MDKINTVGDRINSVRKKQNLTLDAFAKKIGASSRGLVHGWINNKNQPNKERLEQIARLGGVTVNWLLYGVDDFMPPIPVYSPIQVIFNELDNPLFHVPYSSIKELADLSPDGEYFFIMGEVVLDNIQTLLDKITYFDSSIDLDDLSTPKSMAGCMNILYNRFKIDSTFNLKSSDLYFFLEALGMTSRNNKKITPMTNISLFKIIRDKEIIAHSMINRGFKLSVAYKGFYAKSTYQLFSSLKSGDKKIYYKYQLSKFTEIDEIIDLFTKNSNDNNAIHFIPLHLAINSSNLFNKEILTTFYKTFLKKDMKLYDILNMAIQSEI